MTIWRKINVAQLVDDPEEVPEPVILPKKRKKNKIIKNPTLSVGLGSDSSVPEVDSVNQNEVSKIQDLAVISPNTSNKLMKFCCRLLLVSLSKSSMMF
jgi:hypothetical protein